MATIRMPKRPEDYVATNHYWTGGYGIRFRAFRNNICGHNGSIPSCAGRECEFYRRGECYAGSVGLKCTWPYYWRRVDKDGNILDRDGHIQWTAKEAKTLHYD